MKCYNGDGIRSAAAVCCIVGIGGGSDGGDSGGDVSDACGCGCVSEGGGSGYDDGIIGADVACVAVGGSGGSGGGGDGGDGDVCLGSNGPLVIYWRYFRTRPQYL